MNNSWTRFKPGFVCSKADKHKFFLKLRDLNSNFTLTWVILNQLWTTHPGVIRSFCTFGTVPAFVRLIDQQALMKPSLNWRWLCISVRELISCLCQNLLNQQLVTKDTFVLHWAPGLDNCITFVVNMNGLGGSATMIIFYRSNMKGGGGVWGFPSWGDWLCWQHSHQDSGTTWKRKRFFQS